MKKYLSIILAVTLVIGTAALAGCTKNSPAGETTTASATEDTTNAAALETAQISKFDVYVKYDPSKYELDEDRAELFSFDEETYIYGNALDETEIERERGYFDAKNDAERYSEVEWATETVGEYTADTVTYYDGGLYYKEYFITLAEPIDWMVASHIYCCIGETLDRADEVNEIVNTLELGPQA